MWEKIASRRHRPLKVFPYGSKSNEVMLFGTVHYGLKDGREASVDWAARAHLVKENGDVKMDFYQVYLVRTHIQAVLLALQLVNQNSHRILLLRMRQSRSTSRLGLYRGVYYITPGQSIAVH